MALNFFIKYRLILLVILRANILCDLYFTTNSVLFAKLYTGIHTKYFLLNKIYKN